MKAYVAELESPTGRRFRKGIVAMDENGAVRGIMHLQRTVGLNGLPKCQAGEVKSVWPREASRPIPKKVLESKDAVQLLQFFPLKF